MDRASNPVKIRRVPLRDGARALINGIMVHARHTPVLPLSPENTVSLAR